MTALICAGTCNYYMTGIDYNTQRPRLIISEYGRNVQKMVEHCSTIEDRAERTRMAKAIIKVIGHLNPQLRNSEDGDHTLWDHLYIMSDFKLDVDAPFPMPTAEELNTKPRTVEYPKSKIRFAHYGKIAQDMIQKCLAMEEGEEREAYTLAIANLMKRNFINWNRDNVGDDVILKDLDTLSGSKLAVKDPTQITAASDFAKITPQKPERRSGGRRNKRGRSRNRRR